jgi:hypothetical protein
MTEVFNIPVFFARARPPTRDRPYRSYSLHLTGAHPAPATLCGLSATLHRR